jgi:chlorobactene glucosyltransferase
MSGWEASGLPWLAVVSSIGLLVGLGITYWLHSQYHLDIIARPVPPPEGEAPLVSVVVPARNEARNIRRCIQGLLAQDYPDLEVIVVDDRSTDETGHILAEIKAAGIHNLHILQGKDLPPDWAGKPHALAQGVVPARGQWLCFVDADTFGAPGLITAVMAQAQEHQADLFTILTQQELGSFWEKVILPLVFTALSVGFSPRRVNDPRYPDAIANGQFILIRRAVYEALGGHEAIRNEIVEDKALAQRVKSGGYRLLVGDGRLVARTRMYTRFAEIWEGWTKNIYLGMRDRLGLLLFGALVGLVGALVLPGWLVGGVLVFQNTAHPLAAVIAGQALILWMALIYARARASRGFGISAWYAFSLPLGAAVFTAMMFASAFKVISGRGVTWKGRRYNA